LPHTGGGHSELGTALQFEARFKELIRAGAISLTFRYWHAPRVRVGAEYRVAPDITIRVGSITPSGRITAADARRSGFESVAALRAYLTRTVRGEARTLYRIEFERVTPAADPRARLARQPLDRGALRTLEAKLDAMDHRSPTGPWTRRVLEMIDAAPGRRAGDLAAAIGWETPRFKQHVRRLKTLGLTQSLEVGYRLSVRGRSLLAAADR
jgi:hypothetical protein